MAGARHEVAAVIGTAGHVDHGKTSLVRALTGMETDRLPEERARGISIELGFAWLDRPAGRVAFIDVPGHERFVRQMVAGATGIDAVVMVVAADEGVMPQTREHLDICGLLGVQRGLVVLSRVDLVEPGFLDLAKDDVAAEVRGTFLEGAPVVPFSIHDPEAVGRVLAALDALVAGVARAEARDRPFSLAIDRAFSRPGLGTIVTGTSRAGLLAVGDEVVVHHPQMTSAVARVRGLEVHGEAVASVGGGRRVAVNLSGVAATDLPRGARIGHAGVGEPVPASMWDVEIEALARLPIELPDGEKGLACFGASVVEASLGLLDRAAILPGARVLAQLRLAEPLALLPGERFVFRGFRDLPDVAATLGGGRVLAPSPRRRKRAHGVAELAALAGADLTLALAAFVAAAGEAGVPWRRLHAALPWPRAAIDEAIRRSDLVRTSPEPDAATLVAPAAVASLAQSLDETLAAFHRAEPAAAGMPADELRTRLRPSSDPAVFAAVVDALARRGGVERSGAFVARAGFSPSTSTAEDALDQALLAVLTHAGLMPPRTDELAPLVGNAPQAKVDGALVRLVAARAAVRVSKDTAFAHSALAALEAKVRAHFSREEWLDAQALKELTGATRKWSIPLGEWLDRAHITVRVGDKRRLRKS